MTNSADQGSRVVTWGLAAIVGGVIMVVMLLVALVLVVLWGMKGLVVAVLVCALAAFVAARVLNARS